ncbi:probable zinc metalloprotease EGY1, chloroplastic isoform X3 [Cryptomeria japonica]|uniref:probable zinc metalloprotease EGY1, chloroplastic isoform X3 n=1 Tax=Cryptomeria japonica TaxID=3369 RepID=UPI0027D9EBFD|nr:probable zinc metalloprotease EGY1, chloroplastic isoform X3 [Cryptomeria japonica]
MISLLIATAPPSPETLTLNSSLHGKVPYSFRERFKTVSIQATAAPNGKRTYKNLCTRYGSFYFRGDLSKDRISINRLKCYSNGDEENDDKGHGKSSASTTTEKRPEEQEPKQPALEPPSASSSTPPLGSTPKNFQVDAFKLMELLGPEKVDPSDVKLIKEKLFGYTTFWVTGEEPFGDLGEGVLFLGNLRGQREEVFAKLQRQLREVAGNKYNLFMVEEPNSEGSDPRGGPRVSFGLLRKEVSEPRPTSLWQYVVAFILFLLTAGSCVELGLASQLQRLPPEVAQYFTNPEATEPPDLQLLVPYMKSTLPLAYGVLGVQLFHFKSVLPDKTTQLDVSVAGPLAGGALSFAMFGIGLLLSINPDATGDLIQVPSLLFQGSLLLGLISRATLGYNAMHSATVLIHPLVIAGWCGLTTTAFNMLPVGCLDGGRSIQAAFGKNALVGFGLTTYALLGLGVLGGPLSLPWGLYILICQRSPEKPCLNDVSEVGSWRRTALTIAIFLVVLVLLPLWDDLAEELGIGLITTSL